MKRFLCLVLALVLFVGMVPMRAEAAKGDKLIAITFDDGPNAVLTPKLLDGLKSRNVKATFFTLGECAQPNLDIVRRAYDEGHEIGNHSWSHPELTSLSLDKAQWQITHTSELLDQVCGKGTKYLVRPPYGSSNEAVRAILGSPSVLWSIDTNDWQYGYDHVYNHIINNAYDGAIILCHDIHSTTIPAALDAIDVLLDRGYEFVTVSELWRRRGVELKVGTRIAECRNNGTDLGPVAAPTITYEPEGNGARVTINSPSGAPVWYTTDGSRLTQESNQYAQSFYVDIPCEIKAVAAYNINGGRSDAATLSLKKKACASPVLTVENGIMTVTCATEGAPIYYTLDGSEPNEDAKVYTGPVTLTPGCTIRLAAGGGAYELRQTEPLLYSQMGNLFADVPATKWYYSAIDRMASMGLMNGVGDYRFAPESKLTRAMLVTLLYRYDGETLESGWKKTHSFADVETGKYYTEAVEWAFRNEIVNGYSAKEFGPNNSLTRQEMAKIICGFLTYRGKELPEGKDCTKQFTDSASIAGWAKEYVDIAVTAGLLKGMADGSLSPKGTATRAEVSTVIGRMIDLEATLEDAKPEQKPEETEPVETLPNQTDKA